MDKELTNKFTFTNTELTEIDYLQFDGNYITDVLDDLEINANRLKRFEKYNDDIIINSADYMRIAADIIKDLITDRIKDKSEIVRCCECKYTHIEWSPYYGYNVIYCDRFLQLVNSMCSAKVEFNGFCAWGVKRDTQE